jgi:hypothetical protein
MQRRGGDYHPKKEKQQMNDEKQPVKLDKIRLTKTYSMVLGDVTRVKDVAELLGKSDAAVLSLAIRAFYFQTFPNEQPVKSDA